MKVSYYEKVIVRASDRFPNYIGKMGVVLGISEDDDRIYAHTVFFQNEDEGVSFLPTELEATGELVDRSEFYDDGDRVRVRVDGDEGSLIK